MSGLYDALKDFQTLISAIFALGAAFVAYAAATKSARTNAETTQGIARNDRNERTEERRLRTFALAHLIYNEAGHIKNLVQDSIDALGRDGIDLGEDGNAEIAESYRGRAVRLTRLPAFKVQGVAWEELALLDPDSQRQASTLARSLDELAFLVDGLQSGRTRFPTVLREMRVLESEASGTRATYAAFIRTLGIDTSDA